MADERLKILIIRLSAIGDVIHCLPAVHTLRLAIPNAEITWLVEAASYDLVANNPAIDRVLVFPGKRWLQESRAVASLPRVSAEAARFFSDLRKEQFDAALEMQGLLKSSLLAWASGARVRVGFADTREFADRFLTHRLDVGDYFGHYVPVVKLNNMVAEYLLKVLGVEQPQAPITFPLPPAPPESVLKIDSMLGPISQRPAPGMAASPSVALTPGAERAPATAAIPCPEAEAAARVEELDRESSGGLPPGHLAGDAADTAAPPVKSNPSGCMVSPAKPDAAGGSAPSVEPGVAGGAAPSVEPGVAGGAASPVEPGVAGGAASSVAPGVAGVAAPSVEPGAAGHAAPSVERGVAGVAAPSVEPGAAGVVAPSVEPGAAGVVAPSVEPGAAGHAAPSVEPGAAGHAAPSVEPGVAGHDAPSTEPTVVGGTAPMKSDPSECMVSPAKTSEDTLTPPVKRPPGEVVFVPGTTWTSKIWPQDKWIELGNELVRAFNCRIILVGGKAERETNAHIVSQLTSEHGGDRVQDLTGQTSFLDLIALFQRVDLVVGADTGPVHLAAAVGKPKVVGVYGATPAGRLGPYGSQCITVALGLWCQPCFAKVCPLSTIDCLNKLEAKMVFQATARLLARSERSHKDDSQ